MKRHFLFPLIATILAGCAGLDIKPISPAEEAAAHAGNTALKGYVIYQPMVVVEVTQKEVCSSKDENNKCKGVSEIICTVGAPFTLPDPSKPFLLDVRSGFGKAGVDVVISNGWQLGNIKDNSDNTAILGSVEKLLGRITASAIPEKGLPRKCKASGLYRVTLNPAGVELMPLLVY